MRFDSSDINLRFLVVFSLLFFVAFKCVLICINEGIPLLRRFGVGQVIQEDGPESHQSKSGTPTMGGLAIVIVLFALSALIYILEDFNSRLNIGAFLALVGAYAAIGFLDDWLTVRPRNGMRGLSSKMKFGLQLIGAVLFVAYLNSSGDLDPTVKLGWLNLDIGWAYTPLAVLFITGMANFVNITDGLDGLAAGLTVILALSIAVMAILSGSDSLHLAFSSVLWILAGAAAGFLWFNFNPAKVFMGDTGSLAIGAAIPAAAIILKLEIVTVIAGMVFILDGLSSALQWAVFKYTRIRTGTGRRIFKMSPIHHHYEMSGIPEQLVVVRFWLVGVMFAAAALFVHVLGLPL